MIADFNLISLGLGDFGIETLARRHVVEGKPGALSCSKSSLTT